MYEFDSVRVSTYEAASLAGKLTERSAEGWDVVAIVPAGSDITAFLKRSSSADDGATADATTVMSSSAAGESASTEPPTSSSEVGEPSGWGTAPEAAVGASAWGQAEQPSSSDTGSSWGSGASTSPAETSSGGWGSGASGASTATSTPTAPASPATPSVPAGWYHDPAGRFELRYWDGSAWTEHVSRNGQQYTDPPVA